MVLSIIKQCNLLTQESHCLNLLHAISCSVSEDFDYTIYDGAGKNVNNNAKA